MDERRPPPGSAQIQTHTLLQAETTATAAINNEAALNGLPQLEHPAPPLEISLRPLLSKLSRRKRLDMSESQRKHSFKGACVQTSIDQPHRLMGPAYVPSIGVVHTLELMRAIVYGVSSLVPVDQHPYSPYPGAGGESVGAASERQQEREVAEQVLVSVEHCFRRLKAGLKVRAIAVQFMPLT